jgi:hypothetical protein
LELLYSKATEPSQSSEVAGTKRSKNKKIVPKARESIKMDIKKPIAKIKAIFIDMFIQ